MVKTRWIFVVTTLIMMTMSCQNRPVELFTSEGTVTGFVYNDINRNGNYDPGTDKPLKNVKVSNGLDITITDKRGVYELPLRDNAPIFVIKPSGYSLPLDNDNKPIFYHMNVTAGASGSRYPGIDPTGPIEGALNFALYKNKEPNNIKVLVFGDTQTRDNKEIGYLQQEIIDDLIGTDADFGITLGDVAFDNLNVFDNLTSSIADIGIPWVYVPGNHDLDHSADNNTDALGTWYNTFGPDYYSFDYGPAHFVVLNDIRWITDSLGSRYRTGLGEAQFEFFRRDLELMESDQLLVLLTHIPFINSTAWANETERERFFTLLSNHPSSLTLAAHTHLHYHEFIDSLSGYPGQIPHHMVSVGTSCGSWWSGAPNEFGIPHATMADGTPVSYSWLKIDGNSWKIKWQGAGRDSDYQMQIGAPAIVADSAINKNILVTANIFNALPNAEVKIRINNQEWITMERNVRVDSVRLAMNIAEKALGEMPWRTLTSASSSRHLWEAEIDLSGLKPGAHLLEVNARDKWWDYKGYRQILIEK